MATLAKIEEDPALPWPTARLQALVRLRAPLLFGLALMLLTLAPYLVAIYGTPPGAFFRGSLRPSTDEGVYLTAVRLGSEGNWLWHDPFAVQSPDPILMYPTYHLAGHLGAWLGLSVRGSFALYHLVAALLLFAVMWRLARRYVKAGDHLWFAAFAFAVSGLYWLDALLAAAGTAPVSLTRMGQQHLSGFSLPLIVAHEAVGVAGQLIALTGLLDALRAQNRVARHKPLLWGAFGSLLTGLSFPALLPLTVAVATLTACAWWLQTAPRPTLLRLVLTVLPIIVPAVPFILYYYLLFNYTVWRIFQNIHGLDPMEGLLTWGLLLPLAWWGWRKAPAQARPLADMLAIWCLCAVIGTVLNIWQSSRLSTGINLVIGALFALGLLRPEIALQTRRRWLLALSFGLACQYLFLLTALWQGHASHLYNSPAKDQALRWLALHTTSHDVVLAPFFFGNVAVERMPAHVVAGDYDLTVDFPQRYPQLQTFFDANTATATRLKTLRATHATFVVYDPEDPQEGAFDPRTLPNLQTAFTAGDITVLHVVPTH